MPNRIALWGCTFYICWDEFMLKRLLFAGNFLLLAKLIWKNQALLFQLIQRNISIRYKGAVLGGIWCFVQPLLMLCVYTFVFSVVFKARWGMSLGDSQGAFAVIMFCGMAIFNIFSESLIGNCNIILTNQNYVQKVIFPLEMLPVAHVATSFVLGTVWFILLLAGVIFVFGTLSWTMFLILPILIILFLFSLGFSFLVAALGVYLRDTLYVVQVLLQILFFLTPIFYPVGAVPERFRLILQINPLTIMIEEARKVFLFGTCPDWSFLGIAFLISLLVMQLGFAFFYKTQKGFADVL